MVCDAERTSFALRPTFAQFLLRAGVTRRRTHGSLDPDNDVHVLALNSGSSSLKFGLYRLRGAGTDCLLEGVAEMIGEATAQFHVDDAQGCTMLRETAPMATPAAAFMQVLN